MYTPRSVLGTLPSRPVLNERGKSHVNEQMRLDPKNTTRNSAVFTPCFLADRQSFSTAHPNFVEAWKGNESLVVIHDYLSSSLKIYISFLISPLSWWWRRSEPSILEFPGIPQGTNEWMSKWMSLACWSWLKQPRIIFFWEEERGVYAV